ncbi:hypothetical protein [Emticicia fontis]
MKTPEQMRRDLIDYVQESADRVPPIVGKKIGRYVKKFTDNTRQNVSVQVSETGDIIKMDFSYRDSLRFKDMGAGRGFKKGRSISATATIGRRPVKMTNRPIHAQINRLLETVDGAIADFAVSETIPTQLQNLD